MKSFVLYESWAPMIEEMGTDAAGELMKAVFAHNAGEEYEITDPVARVVFATIRKTMDDDADKYAEVCEKRKEARSKSSHQSTNDDNSQQMSTNDDNSRQEPYESKSKSDSKSESKSKANKDIKEERVRASFVKPTVEEVAEYCRERQNKVSPEAFVSYYESNGWKIGGKTAMKDWRAAVRTWEQRESREPPKAPAPQKPRPKWQYQDQRTYDYDELERKLLGRAYES